MKTKNPLLDTHFLLVCVSSLLFSASFNMLIPELPSYLSSLGGAEYKGLIISLFTLTAAISRPFSGKLTDTVGRVPVMAIGSIVCFVCGILYPILTSVAGFLFLRLVHGFSTGFKPTATAAYVADIIPHERWGEGLGIHSLFFSTGLALGPAIGSAITSHFSIRVLFYVSSVLALLSILIIVNVKETIKKKQKFNLDAVWVRKADVFEASVLPAAVTMFVSCIPFGVILTLIPDWSQNLGVTNKGMFFMVLTLSSLLIRFVAGRVSDLRGRIPVVLFGLVSLAISMVGIGYSQTPFALMVSATLYGISAGTVSPAIMAWTVDLCGEFQRGRGFATMYVAMEVGIGIGALLSGFAYANQLRNIPWIMYICGLIVMLSVIYVLRHQKKIRARSV